MKTYGPFPAAERESILLYARDVAGERAELTVRDGSHGFDIEISPDPDLEADARISALAGWYFVQRRKAQQGAQEVTTGDSRPGAQVDAQGFLLHPRRAGISPRSMSRPSWSPFGNHSRWDPFKV